MNLVAVELYGRIGLERDGHFRPGQRRDVYVWILGIFPRIHDEEELPARITHIVQDRFEVLQHPFLAATDVEGQPAGLDAPVLLRQHPSQLERTDSCLGAQPEVARRDAARDEL